MTAQLFDSAPTLAADAPRGLGAAMAGGKGPLATVARAPLDFYPTPAAVTRALIVVERQAIGRALLPGEAIWEPCGRGGAIATVLHAAGFATVATDIVSDPANEVTRADARLIERAPSRVAITNPPFACAAEIIFHLLADLRLDYLALLLKSTFWHAEARTGLWRRFPPARIHALNWRPDFTGGGAATMEVIWCVWQRGHLGATRYDVIGRACDAGQGLFDGKGAA